MSGSATLTIELSMTCISAANTTANAMRYLCGAPSGGAAMGSTSGSSSAGAASRSSALATDMDYSQCKGQPVFKWSGILLRCVGGIQAVYAGRCGVGNVHRLLHRLRAGYRRPRDETVLLALCHRRRAALLAGVLLRARGRGKRND